MTSFGPYRLDLVNQCVWHGETRIALMPKPFAVLKYLVEHHGRLVTHEELLAAIWPDTFVQPEVLRRYILEIRRALGDAADEPRFIRTFPKRGYEFIAPIGAEPAADTPGSSPPHQDVRAPLSRWPRPLTLLGGAALIAALAVAALLGHRSEALRDRDSIVLADFDNRSGEPVFDFGWLGLDSQRPEVASRDRELDVVIRVRPLSRTAGVQLTLVGHPRRAETQQVNSSAGEVA